MLYAINYLASTLFWSGYLLNQIVKVHHRPRMLLIAEGAVRMAESRELIFTKEDLDLYGKLDAARRDLFDASSYGAFIMKKGWTAKPWGRGSTYLQQSAFMTAMIVSYGRAFTRSDGWPRLPSQFLSFYDHDETALHNHIMTQRHQVYAHSDSVSYPIKPWKSDYHSDIIQFRVLEMDYEDIKRLQGMCQKIADACGREQARIKSKY